MNEMRTRRWFRFRLSTVLILTAILAWGMAQWPWWWYRDGMVHIASFDVPQGSRPPIFHDQPEIEFNVRLLYPVLALFAFLAWKAAWAVVERRRARRATHF